MSPTSYGMSFLPSWAHRALWDMLGPSTQGKPGAGKVNFSEVQSLLWFLNCWKCFTSPETKSGMHKDRQILLFDAASHYTDLVLQCSLNLWENEHCDGAAFFKTASPTKDNRQSLREQHTENHLPSIQKVPPEIPVKNLEQVGISKQHHNMSKHIAKNTAAHGIWYPSSMEQVCEHETMQQDVTPEKAERKQWCIWPCSDFSLLQQTGSKPCQCHPPSYPMLCRCHRPWPAWIQTPEG